MAEAGDDVKATAPEQHDDPWAAKVLDELKSDELLELHFTGESVVNPEFMRAVVANRSVTAVDLTNLSPFSNVLALAALNGHAALQKLHMALIAFDARSDSDDDIQRIGRELGTRVSTNRPNGSDSTPARFSTFAWHEPTRQICGTLGLLLSSLDHTSALTDLHLCFRNFPADDSCDEWDALWNRVAARECRVNLTKLRVSCPSVVAGTRGVDLNSLCDAIGIGLCDSLTELGLYWTGEVHVHPTAEFDKFLVAATRCRSLRHLQLPALPWHKLNGGGGFPRECTRTRVLALETAHAITLPGLVDALTHADSPLQALCLFGHTFDYQEMMGFLSLDVADWWLEEMKAVGRAPALEELFTPELRGHKTFTALAESIRASQTLETLHLHHSFPDEPNAILPVIAALRASPVLTQIIIYAADYTSEVLREFAAALRVNRSLISLDLSYPLNTADADRATLRGTDSDRMPALHAFIDALARSNRTLFSLYAPSEWYVGLNVEWTKMMRRNGGLYLRNWWWLQQSDSLSEIHERIESVRWSWHRFAPVLAFVRANRGHAFQHSVFPLIDAVIMPFVGGEWPVVPALRFDRFFDTEFGRAVVTTAGIKADGTFVSASTATN